MNKSVPDNIAITKNYDSEFCGSIPLHLVNLIQPHGMLLVLDKSNLNIIQASENVDQYLSLPVSDLLNVSLADFIPDAQFSKMQEMLAGKEKLVRLSLVLSFTSGKGEKNFTAFIHSHDDYILVELEKLEPAAETSFITLYQKTKYITSLLKQASTTAEATRIAAVEIKNMTGFDRVLVYQFDQHWNGIVIAQAKEEDMDDFMELRFPASDVPKQARDLYFRNPYRLIPTCHYEPVRLQPIINPLTQRFTDLSDTNLRSVAAVHLEYMVNMKIEASMSLPVIIDNQLWGLISCHHKTAMDPGPEQSAALELLSDIIAAQVAAKEREKAILFKANLREVHARVLKKMYTHTGLSEGLQNGDVSIDDLLGLDGSAVLFDGGIWTSGVTPTQQQIKELTLWLRRSHGEGIYYTNSLINDYARSEPFTEVGSGLIAIPVNAAQGEYILGFRQEVKQTLNWGGNPEDAIQMEPDGRSYHPRNSFAIYKQIVNKTALPWKDAEIEAAENLRGAVLEKIVKERY